MGRHCLVINDEQQRIF